MFSLTTDRLLLRDLMPSDWRVFTELMRDVDTCSYMGDHIQAETDEQAQEWVEERIAYNNEQPRHSYNLAIELEGLPIGWIGIGEAEEAEKKDLDFGYALLREHWGKGFMTEALHAVITLCFNTMPIHRITGECEVRNLASQKVMEHAGMKLVKQVTVRDAATGAVREKFRYSILRDE